MKKHITLKSIALAALGLLLIAIPVAMANIPAKTAANTADDTINQFRVIALELPEIDAVNTARLPYLYEGTLDKVLEEKIAFREETRPLVQTLKSKWAALTDELAKKSPKETTSTQLEAEILNLDTRLAEMRLDHIMAMNEIRETAAN